jgi:hypothetical protein
MKNSGLIVGDVLVLALVTFIGFASHAELTLAFVPRMAAAFFPLIIAWFLLAPWFGLFQDGITKKAHELWRPAFVMLFAGPLAVILRGLVLNAPIIPIFAVVLSVTAPIGLILWRLLWMWLKRRVET